MFIERKKVTPDFARRTFILAVSIMVLSLLGVFFAYWNIQVVLHDYFRDRSLRNITKSIDLASPRGMILDRQGRVLAENTLNFTLFLIRENVKDMQRSTRIAAFLADQSVKDVKHIIQRYEKYPKFYMIPIQDNLSLARVAYIESRADEFPEFKIEAQPQRTYPNGQIAAHLLGYIAEIPEEELRKRTNADYKMGDLIGITGIESSYDEYLKGKRGSRTFIKDYQEKMQEIVSEKKPQVGDTLSLTIDFELQKFIEEALGEERGAVGVVDLQDGGILALVSKPGFDPTAFAHIIDAGEWNRLLNAPEKPLQNKFIQGIYSPGSVFKIVMALAALQEKVIDSQTAFYCSGELEIYDRYFHCWQAGGHGYVSVVEALEKSCNVFFYNLGKRMDIDTISRYAQLLGLGETGLVDLPNESRGIVPNLAWKEKTFGQKWFAGETISVAIGEGSLNVTPMQILKMISTVARRGSKLQLHLLDKIKRDERVVYQFKPASEQLAIDQKNFDLVIEGLFRAVNREGTAGQARVEGLAVCGKTGTSQIISKENPRYKQLVMKKEFTPNSWFVSFAPRDNPRIAVVVLIENGGDAGRIAAPFAAKIYRKYFGNEGLF